MQNGGQGVAAMLIEIAIFMLILFVFMRRTTEGAIAKACAALQTNPKVSAEPFVMRFVGA